MSADATGLRGRRLRAATAVACCLAVLLPLPRAVADPMSDAKARADALLAKVHAIQRQADDATSSYDAALTDLGTSVTQGVLARRQADALDRQASEARRRLDERVRGLYMSGGQLGLYATVLDAESFADLAGRLAYVRGIVHVDESLTKNTSAAAQSASDIAATTQARVTAHIATARSVQRVADRLQRLLDEQQRLLDAAQTQVAGLQSLALARAALDAQRAAAASITSARLAALRPLPASPAYMALYKAAATTCPGLSWTVLAAIGQVESGHGRDTSTSYAGAMGPMQFLPSTFAGVAVDGNGDGVADIMNPADAIFSAARYLCQNGGGNPATLYTAIWNYNHADWYVRMVLSLADQYAAKGA